MMYIIVGALAANLGLIGLAVAIAAGTALGRILTSVILHKYGQQPRSQPVHKYYELSWKSAAVVIRRMSNDGWEIRAANPTDGYVQVVFAQV